jgi:hypothetical protein
MLCQVDPLSSLALTLVLTGVFLYALYWVIRIAVRHALQDATTAQAPAVTQEQPPDM